MMLKGLGRVCLAFTLIIQIRCEEDTKQKQDKKNRAKMNWEVNCNWGDGRKLL